MLISLQFGGLFVNMILARKMQLVKKKLKYS